ncbi:MAG: TRAP transporter small permease [Ostreibacterium sp.]
MWKKFIIQIEESFLCLLLLALTTLVFAEVVARFEFNTGIDWAEEVIQFVAAWFVLFGASYGIKVGAHIGVNVFVDILPNKIHRFFSLIAVVLCLIYCGLFLYGSWVYLAKLRLIGIELDDFPIPKWIPSSILFIGFVLLAVRFLQLGWKIIIGQTDGFAFSNEAEDSMALAHQSKAVELKSTSGNRQH